MSETPANLRYTQSHEWIEQLDDGSIRVGITDHAQDLLGDMVYIELPEVGRMVTASEEVAVVESVKAASDVYAPVAGEITAINETLADTPEAVNESPYSDGWLYCVKPQSQDEVNALMDSAAYMDFATSEAH